MELTFGEKIKLLREKKELSQSELGQEVNMTQRKISYLEHDRYEPSLSDIKALCRFFKVSADYLLDLPTPHAHPSRRNQSSGD